jgi:hypothetical protein
MLAVLLALAADSWREDRANRELAALARASYRAALEDAPASD